MVMMYNVCDMNGSKSGKMWTKEERRRLTIDLNRSRLKYSGKHSRWSLLHNVVFLIGENLSKCNFLLTFRNTVKMSLTSFDSVETAWWFLSVKSAPEQLKQWRHLSTCYRNRGKRETVP